MKKKLQNAFRTTFTEASTKDIQHEIKTDRES